MSNSRQSAGAMDAQRKADTVLAIRARALDVYQWVSGVLQWTDNTANQSLSVNDAAAEATVERFFAQLATGTQLCHLLSTLSSGAHAVSHINAEATAGSFQARDNIARFIVAAQALGVSPLVCFDTDDLVLRRNDKKVVNTLMELSRQSAIKYNVTPTKLMQFDMEWDTIQQQQQQAAGSGASQADAASKGGDDDEHEVVESVMTATVARYEHDEKEQPADPASPTTPSIVAPAAASTKQARSASTTVLSAGSAAAHDGDAIDAAISALISAHHFAIPITRVAIKSKKKRRDARKAEYRVGSGPKLFVRLLHGHLIAKQDEEWVDFAEAVQERVRHEIAAH